MSHLETVVTEQYTSLQRVATKSHGAVVILSWATERLLLVLDEQTDETKTIPVGEVTHIIDYDIRSVERQLTDVVVEYLTSDCSDLDSDSDLYGVVSEALDSDDSNRIKDYFQRFIDNLNWNSIQKKVEAN
ncbi:MAG: hypothetical protein K2W88_12675 [Pararheinheimera sp.]|nr:hypothetical protein [Rheinheimera sp.]